MACAAAARSTGLNAAVHAIWFGNRPRRGHVANPALPIPSRQSPRPRASLLHCMLALALCLICAPAFAHAQLGSESRSGEAEHERPKNGYWSVGEPRWFVSAKPELGTPYAKPYISFGYGMPHWLWTGIDINSIVTPDLLQVYGGVRASSPILDLAFGIRDTWSFGKHFLTPAPSYSADDLSRGPLPIARYWAWEAEAVAVAPLPHAALIADFILVHTLDVPAATNLFEESYRAVISDSLFCTLRIAAVARLLREESLRAGVLGEVVFETGRDRPVYRIGPALSLQLTDHLEANAVLTLAVSSPDRLGLVTGAYGVAGLRYRWATGEPKPKAPWSGMFLPW